ncbi:MAG: OsmC family protein [Methylococcaceae bacterium]|nr:OsmC family protein [Methylococcaceae bacterium]
MKTRIKWIEDAMFMGESGSGHALIMDGPPEHGGRNRGPRPMEMLLLGMAGCTAFDVVHILQKGRHPLTDCEVEISAERVETEPKVFSRIHVHFILSGRDLKDSAVNRAIELSAEKYCSATIMLAKTAEISHDYEIRNVE